MLGQLAGDYGACLPLIETRGNSTIAQGEALDKKIAVASNDSDKTLCATEDSLRGNDVQV